MWQESFTKHKGIFISMIGVTLFFIGYLFLNASLQSKSVNASNYLTYVSQLTAQAKTLSGNSPTTADDIGRGLNNLRNGGVISMSNGSRVEIPSTAEFFVADNSNVPSLQSRLAEGDISAVESGMQRLQTLVESERDKKAKLVNTLQIIVGIFTLLLSIIFTALLIRRLSQSEEVDVKTKQEAAGILNTVSEGLFLLGRDHEIGIEQSASLKEMFRQERDLDGNFFDFISQYVTQGDLKVAKDYLELLFGDRVKEKLVASLNPLTSVEINIARRDGSFESRYLSFSFKRVMEDGQLKHLLGSVNDITKQVLLEKELEEAKEEQEAQIDLLKSILHIDNDQLQTFFRTAEADLTKINKTLESSGKKLGESDIHNILNSISQDVHKIKGDAAALGLYKFEFSAHEFEDIIKKAQESSETLTGKSLLPLTTNLRGMFKDLDNMQTLVERFSESLSKKSNGASSAEVEDDSKMSAKIRKLVKSVSERNNYRVHFSSFGLEEENIPELLSEDINDICIQLARNAIAHGAQSPEDRIASNKCDFLNLVVGLTKTKRGYELIVRDDGKGINPISIMKQAISMGIAPAEAMQDATVASCVKYLMHPKFSSAEDASLDAGRGVGLTLVRRILSERKGRISVKSQKDKFCQFHIVLPEPS